MWLSQQHTAPRAGGWSGTAAVTAAGAAPTVRLERETRDLAVFGPAGYRWTPAAGDRVLVFRGEGEEPVVAGTDRTAPPAAVTIAAGTVALEGAVTVNGVGLEDYIRLLVGQILEGTV